MELRYRFLGELELVGPPKPSLYQLLVAISGNNEYVLQSYTSQIKLYWTMNLPYMSIQGCGMVPTSLSCSLEAVRQLVESSNT